MLIQGGNGPEEYVVKEKDPRRYSWLLERFRGGLDAGILS